MTLRPRFMHFLMVAACACAAVTTSPFASSHSPAKLPVSQPQANEKTGFGDNPIERRMAYSSFLKLMDYEERRHQLELDSGAGRPASGLGWAKLLGIREDEEQAMRTIVADAYRRIKEIDDRVYAAGMRNRQNPSAENEEKFHALVKEIAGQGDQIVDETIVKLRQELGEEDFKKLDDYIYRDSPAGMAAVAAKRRADSQNPHQSGSGSDPVPAKEPQP